MIQKAYIHEYGNGRMEPEHKAVLEVLQARGIVCERFTSKRLLRNQLQLDGSTFVAGDNGVMASIFKRIGFPFVNDSYPRSIKKYLGRRIWSATVRSLLQQAGGAEPAAFFVKPKSKAKLFTGFVVQSGYDLLRLEQFAKDTDLYCSEIVHWQAEYRVFVLNGAVVGAQLYTGNKNCLLDMAVVEKAVGDFENSPEKTAAYGIDFGVLNNGTTTLVEWNDGFALGAYGLDKTIYTALLLARWEEILKTIDGMDQNAGSPG